MKVITISGEDREDVKKFIKDVKKRYGGIVHHLFDSNVVQNTINIINKSKKKNKLLSELTHICAEFNEILITEIISFIDSKKGNGLIFIETVDDTKKRILDGKYPDRYYHIDVAIDNVGSFVSLVNTSKN